MSFFQKIFSGNAEKNITAKGGFEAALKKIEEEYPSQVQSIYPVCIYTSVMDANDTIHEDGTCGGWHFDFYLPSEKKFLLIRFAKGKLKSSTREKDEYSEIEYVFALYGNESGEPDRLTEGWMDSGAFIEKVCADEDFNPETEMSPTMLCYPAEKLRYLKEDDAREQLQFPAPQENNVAVLCSPIDINDEKSIIFYLDAATAQITSKHIFQFPNLFYFGTSADW